MAYVFVTGDGKVAAPITVENYIKQILRWISFTIEEQRNRNYDHSIESFSEIRMFKEKYVSDLSTGFSGRTQDIGKIHFEMRRTKRMKGLLHWVQDFYWISVDPTIVELNEVMFIKHTDTAFYRVVIGKKLFYQSNTKAKEASPGPLESENK